MTLDPLTLEKWIDWCSRASELAAARYQAWRIFFDLDDPSPIEYIDSSGTLENREKRFLSWFCLDYLLGDDTLPIEQAIRALVLEPKRVAATKLVHRARFLLGVVKDILPGASGGPQAFFLQVSREQLGVYSATTDTGVQRGEGMILHLVPNGSGGWVAAPGWVRWPIAITPALRRQLQGLRLNPPQVERYLQCRNMVMAIPRKSSKGLAEAVQRMSDVAREMGEEALVLSCEEWQEIVLPNLIREKPSPQHYIQQLLARIHKTVDADMLNRVIDLAMDIWNHTPQPDRDGKSAYQMALGSKPAEKEKRRTPRKDP
ncbi:MAG: hypothetical protein WCO14_05490 [bacterium]